MMTELGIFSACFCLLIVSIFHVTTSLYIEDNRRKLETTPCPQTRKQSFMEEQAKECYEFIMDIFFFHIRFFFPLFGTC